MFEQLSVCFLIQYAWRNINRSRCFVIPAGAVPESSSSYSLGGGGILILDRAGDWLPEHSIAGKDLRMDVHSAKNLQMDHQFLPSQTSKLVLIFLIDPGNEFLPCSLTV